MKEQDLEFLKTATKTDIKDWIRYKLTVRDSYGGRPDMIKGYRRRFEFSGYENKTGDCTLHNLSVLNTFAYLGIYDYTDFIFLDFYKGSVDLHYKFFQSKEYICEDLTGYGTVDIIFFILNITIFSNNRERRRK